MNSPEAWSEQAAIEAPWEAARWSQEGQERRFEEQWSLRNSKQASSIRKKMAKDMFFNPGHATDKAVEWIVNWFGHSIPKTNEKN